MIPDSGRTASVQHAVNVVLGVPCWPQMSPTTQPLTPKPCTGSRSGTVFNRPFS